MDDRQQVASNALTHGLTSRQHLPAALTASVVQHLANLQRDPGGYSRHLLMQELARQAAFLDIAAAAEQAALRAGAASAAIGAALIPANSIQVDDAMLSAAAATDQVERISRYRRAHERGFHQAVTAFLRSDVDIESVTSRPWYIDEERCRAYLIERLNSESWRCPRCGCARGAWLASRSRRECAQCAYQAGLRCGTVFAKSALPLSVWFRAIILIAARGAATPDELERLTGLRRRATLRVMQQKIVAAVASPAADRLLAGLQNPHMWGRVPESGAPSPAHSAKRNARITEACNHRTAAEAVSYENSPAEESHQSYLNPAARPGGHS